MVASISMTRTAPVMANSCQSVLLSPSSMPNFLKVPPSSASLLYNFFTVTEETFVYLVYVQLLRNWENVLLLLKLDLRESSYTKSPFFKIGVLLSYITTTNISSLLQCISTCSVMYVSICANAGLGLSKKEAPQFGDPEELRAKFTQIFASKTQAEWCAIFDNTDACVAPVVSLQEAHNYPHNKQRRSFVPGDSAEGRLLPRPAPRMSAVDSQRTDKVRPQPQAGEHTTVILQELGYSQSEIKSLLADGAVEQHASAKL